jgi:hypothetical protein
MMERKWKRPIDWKAIRATVGMALGASGIGIGGPWHVGVGSFVLALSAAFMVLAVIENQVAEWMEPHIEKPADVSADGHSSLG